MEAAGMGRGLRNNPLRLLIGSVEAQSFYQAFQSVEGVQAGG